MSTVTIAPHLWKALEVMGRDMAVEPAALVNQAAFAWLRINGYLVPGTVGGLAHATPVDTNFALTPAEPAQPQAVTEQPVVAPLDTVARRIEEIDADLARLTKPQPAWAKRDDEEEEEEENDSENESESSQHEDGDGEREGDEPEDHDEERAVDESEEAAPSAVADEPFEDPTPVALPAAVEEPVSGEAPPIAASSDEKDSEDEDSEGEGTFVLRSAPTVLVIAREGQEPVRVNQARFVIGRGPQCDLVIESPRVSREHVSLTRQGATFLLEDLGSSNGTWLDAERITVRELQSGDVILLGNEPVTFTLQAG